MMRALRVALLLCLWLAAHATARAEDPENRIVLSPPAAGEIVTVAVEPGMTLELTFTPSAVILEMSGDDLLLRFDDGGLLVLHNLAAEAQQSSVNFDILGTSVPAAAVLAHLWSQGAVALPDAAASSGSWEDAGPELAGLRHSGRELLFSGETERAGHPLYSYLLFAGASGGNREEHQRFRAAIEAYVGQFRDADDLESSGAQRREVNIFYAPMKAIFEDTTAVGMGLHFAQRTPEEQVSLLLDLYDYARAEVLLGRLQISGGGPYIVSVLRPLSQQLVSADEAFLVQDLSGVPPKLVTLWVAEFKRQVVQKATDSPEHLRDLALELRTQIAVLADAFAITKSAVAEMFDEPKSGGN